MKLASFGIQSRILLGMSLLVAGYVVSIVAGFLTARSTTASLRTLSAHEFPLAMRSQSALFQFETSAKLFTDATVLGDEEALREAETRRAAVVADLDAMASEAAAAGLANDDILRLRHQIADLAPARSALFSALSGQGNHSQEAVQQMAQALAARTQSVRDALSHHASTFNNRLDQSIGGIGDSLHRDNRHSLFLATTVVLAGCVLVYWIVRRSIVAPIQRIVAGLGEASASMHGAAGSVTSSSQTVAHGASSQAASLEEISAAVEEMAGMTRRNAENAQTAKTAANEARRAADRGGEAMGRMRVAIDSIQQASREIAGIIKTIDEIAFQTNILALNAAVEAARAGQAGAGFAVVADEVRSLAQRSATAARETADKIEVATGRSAQGAELSAEMDTILQDILGKTAQVDSLVVEIATASEEQTRGITQITTSMGQLDQHTQGNAASAEEAAAAAEEMRGQVGELRDLLSRLDVAVYGARPATFADDGAGALDSSASIPSVRPFSHTPVGTTAAAAATSVPARGRTLVMNR
jgi:methyl-accepting chemotaxis protein